MCIHLSFFLIIRQIGFNQQVAGWPSGLRRQFKALVFGRGFESHFSHMFFVSGDHRSEGSASYTVAVVCRDDAMRFTSSHRKNYSVRTKTEFGATNLSFSTSSLNFVFYLRILHHLLLYTSSN